jgi:hypothetical protein
MKSDKEGKGRLALKEGSTDIFSDCYLSRPKHLTNGRGRLVVPRGATGIKVRRGFSSRVT